MARRALAGQAGNRLVRRKSSVETWWVDDPTLGWREDGWEDVTGVAWNKSGGLDIQLCTGKRIGVGSSLGNLSFLKQFIEERLGRGRDFEGSMSATE